MCGIVGFNWDEKALLKQMMDSIKHRGPDQCGTYTDKDISFGHQRLSIIDLSEKGRQPIFNEDNTIAVIFNGEIYNYKLLKKILEDKGHRFYTGTDTEVIVHAYEEYGKDCANHFNGCFAFAIWDSNRKELYLIRDRLGVKPLYYLNLGDKFLFASEIKALLEFPEFVRKLNPSALHSFLSFRCNHTFETMFKGICKVPPGHVLKYSDHNVELSRYWHPQIGAEKQSELYYSSRIRRFMEDAVRMRLMSEVPLGVYLSSGIDSASIVGLMSHISPEPVETFSVGFGAANEFNELSNASRTAEYFKTNHHEIMVEADTAKLLPKIVWHLDEPMSDATSIPVYLLSEKAKKYVTVVLTGDGGDEAFGGYEQFKFMKYHHRFLKKVPQSVRKAAAASVSLIPPKLLNHLFEYSESLGIEGMNRFSEFATSNDDLKAYLSLVSVFNEREKKSLYASSLDFNSLNASLMSELRSCLNAKDAFMNKIINMDTSLILAEDMLMKTDKNTMAHAVEARVPFLDYNIMELSYKIPPSLKIAGMTEKYILRKAMSDVLPRPILTRKKSRFFVPIDSWFESGLIELAKNILSEETIKKRGIFDYTYVDKAFKGYKESKLYFSRQIWSLVNFEIWCRTYLDNSENKPIQI
jgi:asparagine synthase (glutamine-hydrolysing)